MECNQHRSKSGKKEIETSWLSAVDRVHVAHSAPMSTEELSTVFIKGGSSVLVVLEDGHEVLKQTLQAARSSIFWEFARVGHSGVTCHGVWNSCISEVYHLVQGPVQKAFGTPAIDC